MMVSQSSLYEEVSGFLLASYHLIWFSFSKSLIYFPMTGSYTFDTRTFLNVKAAEILFESHLTMTKLFAFTYLRNHIQRRHICHLFLELTFYQTFRMSHLQFPIKCNCLFATLSCPDLYDWVLNLKLVVIVMVISVCLWLL